MAIKSLNASGGSSKPGLSKAIGPGYRPCFLQLTALQIAQSKLREPVVMASARIR